MAIEQSKYPTSRKEAKLRARSLGYHIDHIYPISKILDESTSFEEAIIKSCELSNLRMIPGKDNMTKGNKVNG